MQTSSCGPEVSKVFDGNASANLPSNGSDTHVTNTTKRLTFGRLLKAPALKLETLMLCVNVTNSISITTTINSPITF